MSEPYVLRADHGPVIVLTLNRPERRNALSRAVLAPLSDALDAVDHDPSCRAVVLSGAGPVFSAGLDLKEVVGAFASPDAERLRLTEIQALADLIDQIHHLSKPVIAALNGDALAGGAGLATACDFVIAVEHARIGYPEVRRGLVTVVVLPDLVRQVGGRRARALLLTGEPITAAEAERWGLVNRVVEAGKCLDEAIGLGRKLIASAPKAIQTTKRQLDEATGWPASLRGAAAILAAISNSEEAAEGMRAFLEKRPPRWASEASAGDPP
ncbi:MAG: enoyl-CoA hydratase/isomerase family protein [Planctomycetaceae bacterium]|nr:enoyl-CoA hydratase/isomerase family protein [Planctomycetaceae bacterium]MBV8676622.1 enoyl-CoA hydratase/isomerase family protein [Planctomycetaceae bacterium]